MEAPGDTEDDQEAYEITVTTHARPVKTPTDMRKDHETARSIKTARSAYATESATGGTAHPIESSTDILESLESDLSVARQAGAARLERISATTTRSIDEGLQASNDGSCTVSGSSVTRCTSSPGQMVCRSETEPGVCGDTVLANSLAIRQQSSGLSKPVGETHRTVHSFIEDMHSANKSIMEIY